MLLDKLVSQYKKWERFFGSAKFAVIIIMVFAVVLIFGTFQESYHGTDFAQRLIYKSPAFFVLQFFMFLSIFMATLIRLPYKKHLAGFYVLHSGLLILFLGSFITFYAGVDGNLTLPPNLPNKTVFLNQEKFIITFLDRGLKLEYPLPYNAFETDLDIEVKSEKHKNLPKIKMANYLPFSDNKLRWVESNLAQNFAQHSTQYQLFNDRFSENLIVSLHPKSDFESSMTMGLLNIHYMPKNMFRCYEQSPKSGLIVWNVMEQNCFTPEEKKIKINKTKKGQRTITITHKKQKLTFFPDLSPLPMQKDLRVIENSPYRIFSLTLFQEKPHLFLFGKQVAYYDRDEEIWMNDSFEKNDLIELPWMGFKLRLRAHHESRYPIQSPVFHKPVQDNGKIIKGEQKALLVKLRQSEYWIKDTDGPIRVLVDGEKVEFELKRTEVHLNFEINLDRFKMDTDPGTNNPASYESFVTLFTGQESTKHHVYMNNPLKYENFTFYQASYFPAGENIFGSVFSVNFDPGRPWKYLGSLLLVLGSFWHFFLRNRKKKTQEVQND
jgi:hypothetical protein